jgi:hypothetical protein
VPSTGSQWTTLWSVAVADRNVSGVGVFFDTAAGFYHSLVVSGRDDQVHLVPAPSPRGTDEAILAGAVSAGDTEWAVGLYHPVDPRAPLIMKH